MPEIEVEFDVVCPECGAKFKENTSVELEPRGV